VLSPVGLINLLTQVKFLIDNVKQEKNIEKLKIEIRKLMESISTIFKKSETLGSSIKKSLNTYNEFVGTFNSRFLPRISNMSKLGIEMDSKKNLEKLRKISFDGGLIEAEILEEEEEVKE
jgi:DNA anti-recombination protein RmuC